MNQYYLFWGGPLSNFAELELIPYKGELWRTSEHIFMAEKALHFGDMESYEKIREAVRPNKAKALGRKVKGFSDEEWDKVKVEKMMLALEAKFSVPVYRDFLKKTRGQTLVEASPWDRIWGIGFDAENALRNKENWGQNLLGKCLLEIRNKQKLGVNFDEI